eukprot:scaffold801_cov178-Ochromonas_danica.AAC.23
MDQWAERANGDFGQRTLNKRKRIQSSDVSVGMSPEFRCSSYGVMRAGSWTMQDHLFFNLGFPYEDML